MRLDRGFKPVAEPDARVLILGSMPGVASLNASQYYAFPRNAFWRIMGDLFDAGPQLDYQSRLQRLTSCGIALWDVVAVCHRPGSLDSAIHKDSLETNDFKGFFLQYPQIRQVYFNGQKAAQLFERMVLPATGSSPAQALSTKFEYQTLPSTSPAHAARSYEDKLEAWSVIKAGMEEYSS